MQKTQLRYLLFAIAIIMYSCKTSRQLPYFKDLPDTAAVTNISTTPYEPLRLQANDEIQVTITSTSPEASRFFNLAPANAVSMAGASSLPASASGANNLYRVAYNGAITMPVLGDIKVEGLTTDEVKQEIMKRLKDYLKDAVVTVNITNFKVTVIGEVNRPVVVPVSGQTINVLEAVGASGDMTVFGIRKNVRILRKMPDGRTEVAVLDFNKANVLQSPYFQLKQNDIVYIQPNKSKGLQGTRSSIWIPIITTLISVTAIIATRN